MFIEGKDLFALKEAERITLRRDKIGFIFQNFGLLPLLSARENVGVPLRMKRVASSEREERVIEALEWVGLAKRVQHRPYELSAGEQQRVALARALAARSDIILADEPTGQLDSHTGKRILDIMSELASRLNITLIIVMKAADVGHELRDGHLVRNRQVYPRRCHDDAKVF